MRWTVVIPAKSLPAAKSRLVPASTDASAHRRLVEAIRADTIGAALAAPGVTRVLVVVDGDTTVDAAAFWSAGHDDHVHVLAQSAGGLNPALIEAAEHAARFWPADGVAALVGDLPALQPDELAEALTAAGTLARAHVPDAAGTGTTLLTATPGATLRPRFGAGSAARHAVDTVCLAARAGLRTDVDTAADLEAAAKLGVGPATAALLAEVGIAGRSPLPGIMTVMGSTCVTNRDSR